MVPSARTPNRIAIIFILIVLAALSFERDSNAQSTPPVGDDVSIRQIVAEFYQACAAGDLDRIFKLGGSGSSRLAEHRDELQRQCSNRGLKFSALAVSHVEPQGSFASARVSVEMSSAGEAAGQRPSRLIRVFSFTRQGGVWRLSDYVSALSVLAQEVLAAAAADRARIVSSNPDTFSPELERTLSGIALSLMLQLSSQGKPSPDTSSTATPRSGDPRVLVPQLLGSNTPRDRAWGAVLAGQNHLKEFVPELLGELDQHIQDMGFEEQLVSSCALDSLIQLDAAIPPDMLQPIFDLHHRAAAIILASNSVQGLEPNLLKLMDENLSDAEWLAIGNTLSEAKAPGFAASLLREIKIEVSVFVTDDPSAGYGIGGDFGSGSSNCGGGIRMPDGFPPVAYYWLTTSPQHKSVALGPGPHPVYYGRGVIPDNGGYAAGSGSSSRDETGSNTLPLCLTPPLKP